MDDLDGRLGPLTPPAWLHHRAHRHDNDDGGEEYQRCHEKERPAQIGKHTGSPPCRLNGSHTAPVTDEISSFDLFQILFGIDHFLHDRSIGRNGQEMQLAADRPVLDLKCLSMIDRRPNRQLVQCLRVFNAERR